MLYVLTADYKLYVYVYLCVYLNSMHCAQYYVDIAFYRITCCIKLHISMLFALLVYCSMTHFK